MLGFAVVVVVGFVVGRLCVCAFRWLCYGLVSCVLFCCSIFDSVCLT